MGKGYNRFYAAIRFAFGSVKEIYLYMDAGGGGWGCGGSHVDMYLVNILI